MTHIATVRGRRGKGLRSRKRKQRKAELGALLRPNNAARKGKG